MSNTDNNNIKSHHEHDLYPDLSQVENFSVEEPDLSEVTPSEKEIIEEILRVQPDNVALREIYNSLE
jgi:hypothetical protein